MPKLAQSVHTRIPHLRSFLHQVTLPNQKHQSGHVNHNPLFHVKIHQNQLQIERFCLLTQKPIVQNRAPYLGVQNSNDLSCLPSFSFLSCQQSILLCIRAQVKNKTPFLSIIKIVQKDWQSLLSGGVCVYFVLK